jgi:hypothetical protein
MSEQDARDQQIGGGTAPSLADQIAAVIETLEIAKDFLHESGTDPEAWLDTAIGDLRGILKVSALAQPKYATDDDVRDSAKRMMKKHAKSLEALVQGVQPSPERSPTPCINCGEQHDGSFTTGFEGDINEGAVGPLCSQCWEFLRDTFQRALLAENERLRSEQLKAWTCKARRTADPPQDCTWPSCGCDPYADKVIAALEEAANE